MADDVEVKLAAIERQLAPAPAPAQEPDIDLDPVGALKVERAARLALQAQMADQTRREQEAQAGRRAFVEVAKRYNDAAAEVRQQAPDFDAAYKHYIATLDRTLAARGHTDPAERANMIAADEIALAQRAFSAGENPAKRVYAAAEALGYRKAAAAADAGNRAAVDPLAELMQLGDRDFEKVSREQFKAAMTARDRNA